MILPPMSDEPVPNSAAPPARPRPDLPPADRRIGPDDVDALLGRLRPVGDADLLSVAWAPEPVLIAQGWDNTLWDVGSLADGTPLALRVARRESAVDLLARELVVLSQLDASGAELPMTIPRVIATGEGAALQPWFPGRDASLAGQEELAAVGLVLADTLALLHLPAPADLARNPVRGVPLAARDAAFRRDLGVAELPAPIRERALAVWEEGLAAPVWSGPGLLLHGDPHPGNVILPDGSRPLALIDFGDTTAGDPASDLGALLTFGSSEELLARYWERAAFPGAEDPALREAMARRAAAWSARIAVAMLTAYPAERPLGRIALETLARL